MPPRRPVSASHSTVVPTLLALLASGVAVTAAPSDAHAQTRTRDGGVQPVPPLPPPPQPPPGGIRPVHPQPPPPPPPPPPDQHPAGGMALVHPYTPARVK
jgi:membrane-anchored mycosin MYCP